MGNNQRNVYAELMGSRRRLEFPSNKYPLNEESEDLMKAIVADAAEVDIHLSHWRYWKEKWYASIACITLACWSIKGLQASQIFHKNVYKDMGDKEQSISREGIKNKNFINWRKAGERNLHEKTTPSHLFT